MEDRFHILRISEQLPFQIVEAQIFESAEGVAAYMWGRSLGKYLIYKNGRLAHLAHLNADVKDLQEYLEKMEDWHGVHK